MPKTRGIVGRGDRFGATRDVEGPEEQDAVVRRDDARGVEEAQALVEPTARLGNRTGAGLGADALGALIVERDAVAEALPLREVRETRGAGAEEIGR